MRTRILFIICYIVSVYCSAQTKFPNGVYLNLEQLKNRAPAYNENLNIQKRTSGDIFMMGGNDYKLTSNNSSTTKSFIKKTILAYVKNDSVLLNCISFGIQPWYALCEIKADNLVFRGAMTNAKATNMAIVGGGLAAGLSASNRYLYALNLNTGKVSELTDQQYHELDNIQMNTPVSGTKSSYKKMESATHEVKQNKIDSIHLNNNNLITGQVIKYTPNKDLKILTTNGIFYFADNDIQRISIHSIDSTANGFDISDQIDQLQKITNKTTKTDHRATTVSTPIYLKYGDGIPVNQFMIQGITDIDGIIEPFDVYLRYKVQAIYTRRLKSDFALGGGIAYTIRDKYASWPSFFVDMRNIFIHNKNFSSASLDIGTSILDYSPGVYLNCAYNYFFRIDKYLFFSLGVNYNYEKYNSYIFDYQGIFSNSTFGLSAGFLF